MRKEIPASVIAELKALPADCDVTAEARRLGVTAPTVRKYMGGGKAAAKAAAGAQLNSLERALVAAGESAGPGGSGASSSPPPAAAASIPPPERIMPNGMTAKEVADELTRDVDSLRTLIAIGAAAKLGAPLTMDEIEKVGLSNFERGMLHESAIDGAPVLYRLCGGAWAAAACFAVGAIFAVLGGAQAVAKLRPEEYARAKAERAAEKAGQKGPKPAEPPPRRDAAPASPPPPPPAAWPREAARAAGVAWEALSEEEKRARTAAASAKWGVKFDA